MKVKVSKVFAAFINKTAKEMGFAAHASVVAMSKDAYKVNVSWDLFAAEQYGDYDWTTGEAKAIRVEYPSGYYAMPQYLTTAELTKEFRSRGVKNEEDLKQMVRSMCEI